VFSGFTYGTITDDQVQGITISNSSFSTLYQGVYLGGVTVVNGGPTGFRLMHNKFDQIYVEGVVINNASLNATGYNVFYDVGNQFQGVGSPASPIISMLTTTSVLETCFNVAQHKAQPFQEYIFSMQSLPQFQSALV
jgi:hypothetical protein